MGTDRVRLKKGGMKIFKGQRPDTYQPGMCRAVGAGGIEQDSPYFYTYVLCYWLDLWGSALLMWKDAKCILFLAVSFLFSCLVV